MVRSLNSVIIRKPCLAIFLINFLSPLTQKTSTVLSHLVCYSLTEDKYGIVQRDIPRIIESLLSFLSALEEYLSELNAKYPPPSSTFDTSMNEDPTTRDDAEKAREVIVEVHGAVKDGLVRIVQTFGERLEAFRFPPRVARRLQEYVDSM